MTRKKVSVHITQEKQKREKIAQSDHNAIILNFELNLNGRGKVKETTKPMWRFTKEGVQKFSRMTESNEVLKKKYKLWTKEFEKVLYKCFKGIHPKKGKTLVGNKTVVKLNRLESSLKQYAKKGKHKRRINKGSTARIQKMIHELIAEKIQVISKKD